MTRIARLLLLLFVTAIQSSPAFAHELRAGYFALKQTDGSSYEVIWKPPVLSGRRLDVVPELPADCVVQNRGTQVSSAGDLIQSSFLSCSAALEGRAVRFAGLSSTLADVLVRLQSHEGKEQALLATPDEPQVTFAESANFPGIFWTYAVLGTQHIWEGPDHLLFVLCLVFLIRDARQLTVTITSFTLAHSLTLAATTLGWVQLNIAPVEAVIALSIVFLASEVLSRDRGEERLSERWPWLIAFVFGLLHGFGFASALSQIGLPDDAVPAALLAFNLGVEFGQLVFVAIVLGLLALLKRVNLYPIAQTVSVYGVGILATVWFIERLV
jgi:hypothetical protein